MSAQNDESRKVALVTGGNRGIGRAVVEELATRGMTVLLGARDKGRGVEVVAELQACGLQVEAVWLDVTEPDSIAAAAQPSGSLLNRSTGGVSG